MQARIDGLVAELNKPDRVKSLESKLEAELEAIREQSLEPASKEPAPSGSVREREEAAEIEKKEQRRRSLRQMQLDRADAEALLSEEKRLRGEERASIRGCGASAAACGRPCRSRRPCSSPLRSRPRQPRRCRCAPKACRRRSS